VRPRLHVSQPALSGTVRGLERDLGIRLFRRTSRHVELTEPGRVFAAEARRLIVEGQRALALVRNSASEIVGPLRIAYAPSVDLRWLCALVSIAHDVQLLSAVPIAEGLLDGTLHAAFYCGSFRHPELHCVSLFRQEFAAVMSARHRLARSCAIGLDDLAGDDIVWLRRDADRMLSDAILSQCAEYGYRPRIAHQVDSFTECLEFARAGLGVTFLPSYLQPTLSDGSIAFVPLSRTILTAECGLVYNRGTRSRELETFIKLARHHASQTANRSARMIDEQKQTIDILALSRVELRNGSSRG
jgi:DNA-binding transcriptional LysR family regulator